MTLLISRIEIASTSKNALARKISSKKLAENTIWRSVETVKKNEKSSAAMSRVLKRWYRMMAYAVLAIKGRMKMAPYGIKAYMPKAVGRMKLKQIRSVKVTPVPNMIRRIW